MLFAALVHESTLAPTLALKPGSETRLRQTMDFLWHQEFPAEWASRQQCEDHPHGESDDGLISAGRLIVEQCELAAREGFEPPVPFRVQPLSRRSRLARLRHLAVTVV